MVSRVGRCIISDSPHRAEATIRKVRGPVQIDKRAEGVVRLRNASRRLAGVYLTVIIFGIVRGLVERGRFPGLQSAVVNANAASRRRSATLRIRQTFWCCLLTYIRRICIFRKSENPLSLIFSLVEIFFLLFFFFSMEENLLRCTSDHQ